MGVVGLCAALCGHRVTISDINEDALHFARANALLNGLPDVGIVKLDWNDPSHFEPYDVVFGSEVIYDRKSYPLLIEFLRRAAAPVGSFSWPRTQGCTLPSFLKSWSTILNSRRMFRRFGPAERLKRSACMPYATRGGTLAKSG